MQQARLATISLSILMASFSFAPALRAGGTAPLHIVVFEPDDLDTTTLWAAVNAGLMPNLQRYIINTGINFNQYFVSDSRGCPTRESYFNGLYFHNIVPATSNHQCGIFQFKEQSTLPGWAHAAGKRTVFFGKYIDGYGYEDRNGDGLVDQSDSTLVPPGWDQWCGIPFYQPVLNGVIPPPGRILPQDNMNQYNWFHTCNGGPVRFHGTTVQDYQSDMLAGMAQQYVQKLPADGRDLLLWIAFGAPHFETNYDPHPQPGYEEVFAWDIRPPQRYLGAPRTRLPQPPNFNPFDLTGKPQWVASKAILNATETANATTQFNDRIQALRAVDDAIGKVVAALAAKGMLNNTVFFFTSDNGWMYGNWRLGAKLAAYDPSIQTPLFVSVGPGVFASPVGATSNALLANVDIVPTIMSIWGITPPTVTDGTSFLPLLRNPSQPWRHQFGIEHWTALAGDTALYDAPTYKAVRTSSTHPTLPNMLFVVYPPPPTSTGEMEWYRYNLDPYAMTNMAVGTPQSLVLQLSQLKSLAVSLAACGGTGANSCHALEWQ